jgi:hypothetical protein
MDYLIQLPYGHNLSPLRPLIKYLGGKKFGLNDEVKNAVWKLC